MITSQNELNPANHTGVGVQFNADDDRWGNFGILGDGAVACWLAQGPESFWTTGGNKSATLRLARTNNVISADYRLQDDWIVLHSFRLEGAIQISLFLYLQTAEPALKVVSFDDLNIRSYGVVFIIDSDGDGLADEDEVSVHHTDPNKSDTDNDGYSDGTEVKNGSDPNNAASIPEMVTALPAVELEFTTQQGKRYQVQASPDLTTWTDSGDAFDGTGGRTYRLVSTRGSARTFWRLRILP